MSEKIYTKREDETTYQYISRICSYHQRGVLSWDDIRDILNRNLESTHSESYYRKKYKNGEFLEDFGVDEDCQCNEDCCCEDECECETETSDDTTAESLFEQKYRCLLNEIRKEKIKLSDERTQNNALLRRLTREETLKEIALEVADKMSAKKILPSYTPKTIPDYSTANEGILCLSDWHYGITIDNFWNTFDPEVCKQRVQRLRDEVIDRATANNVGILHVANLGDLIAGRIKKQIRIQSRYDTVTQTIHVTEMLAELLNELSAYFEIHYYDCLDNHSRIEEDKHESLDLESFARFTPWYLKARVGKNVVIHENMYGQDIMSFDVQGFNVIGVHGDKDKPSSVVKKIQTHTKQFCDLIIMAHRHHFSGDEENSTLVISNGTLMGTDDYASNLRLDSIPSQNLIIATNENVADTIYRITL